MTLVNLITAARICLCIWTSPLRVGLVFTGLLVTGTVRAGQVSGLLGLVAFIIYAGGALVLISYCFMITPKLDPTPADRRAVLLALAVGGSVAVPPAGPIYEFYWAGLLVLSAGVLLFLVILCVVALVDPSAGSLRPVGTYGSLGVGCRDGG